MELRVKIVVLRKMTNDKFIESLICLGFSLFFLATITLLQVAAYDAYSIKQPIFDNLHIICNLLVVSGFMGLTLSITQTIRKKPLFRFKFTRENENVNYLFAYILGTGLVGHIIIRLMNDVAPKTTHIPFEIIYLIHPYLIVLFIVLVGLTPIAGLNVIKTLSENLPKRRKTPKK